MLENDIRDSRNPGFEGTRRRTKPATGTLRVTSCPHAFTAVIVLLLAISPASADPISNVSVNGSIGATGTFLGTNLVCPAFGFNVNLTQQGIGDQTVNGSGQATCTVPPFASMSGTAQQTAQVTSNAISVTGIVDGNLVAGGGVEDNFTANETVGFSFDVTVPTVMDLTISASEGCEGFAGFCGPELGMIGIDVSPPNQLLLVPFHITETLQPGPHFVFESQSTISTTPAVATSVSTFTLDATFTPVPEPRWLALFACLLIGTLRTRSSKTVS